MLLNLILIVYLVNLLEISDLDTSGLWTENGKRERMRQIRLYSEFG